MASTHRFLVHNLFNERQNPTHSIDASAEEPGYEVWHVANGRRKAEDHWRPDAANEDAWVRVDAGASVTCDTVVLDRGHNLAGKTVKLQTSSDLAFTSPTDVLSVTIPSAASAGTAITATNGATTEEGAWIRGFTATSARYWRLFVGASAGFTPQIVGLWLGKSWTPAYPIDLPYEDEVYQVGGDAAETDFGWRSMTYAWRRRQGSIALRLEASDEANARTFYLGATRGHPFWLTHNVAVAEQTVLAKLPPQVTRRAVDPRWFPHVLEFAWEEWEAALP